MKKIDWESEKWRFYAAIFSIAASVFGIIWTGYNFYRSYKLKKERLLRLKMNKFK